MHLSLLLQRERLLLPREWKCFHVNGQFLWNHFLALRVELLFAFLDVTRCVWETKQDHKQQSFRIDKNERIEFEHGCICLHWFDGKTVALVDIYAEVVDHLLQLGLGLFPSLSINLLSLRFGRFSCFLFFFNVFGVFTCHCGWSSTRANHCTGLVAAKRLARLSNFLFRFFNLARFFIGLALAFCFGLLFSLKLFFLLQKASFLVSLVFPLNFLVALFSHAFLFFVKSLLFLQQNFTFSLLYFELLFSFLLFDELSLSLQLRISFLFSLFSS